MFTSEIPDRRVRRTRGAIFEAFTALVLNRRYDEIRVADILEAADIGKSTFYVHFKNKDDVLLSSIEPLFHMLASSLRSEDRTQARFVLNHFWEQRALARVVFNEPVFFALIELLAQVIASVLRDDIPDDRRPLIAHDLASSQLMVIRKMVHGEIREEPEELAEFFSARMRTALEDARSERAP